MGKITLTTQDLYSDVRVSHFQVCTMSEKLSDIEHVRKRPGMYIGDTTSRGLHHLPGEIIGNSIDEFLRGRATRVAVSVQDGIVTVADDGSGMPFDQPSILDGASLANDYLSSFHRTCLLYTSPSPRDS